MLRSDINRLMAEAEATFAAHGYAPPPWAFWSPDDWRAHPEQAKFCAEHQMGWDITDFGSGRFYERGLLLLCTRNGIQNRPGERCYAEKIMIVRENQEAPYHWHKVKTEDIINRGGGDFVIELVDTDAEGKPLPHPVEALIDGAIRRVEARVPIVLKTGESVTLPVHQAHRFYGKPGTGTVLVGEVSQVNDDNNDNFFFEPVGRFASIEEDEPARHPLWSELKAL
jgi:D-lyxose ketol-isomerase